MGGDEGEGGTESFDPPPPFPSPIERGRGEKIEKIKERRGCLRLRNVECGMRIEILSFKFGVFDSERRGLGVKSSEFGVTQLREEVRVHRPSFEVRFERR